MKSITMRARLTLTFGALAQLVALVAGIAIHLLFNENARFENYVTGINARASAVARVRAAIDQRAICGCAPPSISGQFVAAIIGEISAASQEQSRAVLQVGEAVSHMDMATQQNAAMVEEMAAAATEMYGKANKLMVSVSVFNLACTLCGDGLKAQGTRFINCAGFLAEGRGFEPRSGY